MARWIACSAACAGILNAAAITVAAAQDGAFVDLDVNRDPADPNFLTLALSNQAQADRVYDEIYGRVLDRFVRGEIGGAWVALAPESAVGRNQNQTTTSVRSGYVSYTLDKFDFSVAGRDMAADFNNVWLGADWLYKERYFGGLSVSRQLFDASGDYRDQVQASVSNITFYEPLAVGEGGADVTVATADRIDYTASYDLGRADERIDGWLGVAYGAIVVVPDRAVISGFVSYADSERDAELSAAVVETLDKNIVPEFQGFLGELPFFTADFRENTYNFVRSERNEQTALTASLTATYFNDISTKLNGTFSLGAQYVSIDVGDAVVHDTYSGTFSALPDFGFDFDEPEFLERTALLPSQLEEQFYIYRAEAMLSYREPLSLFVPYLRASVSHYSEPLNFRSSQWDTLNYTFEEFQTGILRNEITPNTTQSFPDFDQTFGTMEVGATIDLTRRTRARVSALGEVVSSDLDRWGIGVSLQQRF